ncbi:MAG: hypothetical protein RL490_2453 [Pseudomonadota bacterium]|jgi:predicted metal-binding protein
MAARLPLRRVVTPATRLLAICGKCGRKLGGGFGANGKRTLGKALRRHVIGAKGKRALVRIVETKCLDICPKGAVVLIDSAEPGAVMIVSEGTPMMQIAGALRLELLA